MGNPREEAFARLGGRYEVRVLEPSPPAVTEPPWFADDPSERGVVPRGRELVSPVTTGDLLWDDLAREDADLASWCSERWLGAYRRLAPAPPTLVETRLALHRLAEHAMSPARRRASSKIALRYTRGGFGTPFFGSDAQLRVEGGELVVQAGGGERRGAISTLRDAVELIGPELAGDDSELDDAPLPVDPRASRFLGDWYGFAASVLEQLRAEARPELDASRVQLWPEHFDIATELGSEAGGQRAGYGASPGDDDHPEPYLSVVPWTASPEGDLWQAASFSGAEQSYPELLEAGDQRAAALGFFRARLLALTG
jgi:hypothetical protein